MPRPNQRAERRLEFLPVIARCFADLGYRRTTTSQIAASCDVRENILYRLWPDKRAMFIAALDYVYQHSEEIWGELLSQASEEASAAELLLDYESTHQGEFGLYRIVFAGLSETDDPEIAAAMRELYGKFHRFLRRHVKAHIGSIDAPESELQDPTLIAWAIVGLGTMSNISRELGLLPERARKKLVSEVGRALLGERR